MKQSSNHLSSKPNVDILIFDSIGLRQLSSCVPYGANTQLLTMRSKTPYKLKLSFLKALLKHAWAMLRNTTFSRQLLILLTFVDYYQPKLILSLADNNKLLLEFSGLSSSPPIYLIQNAIRRQYRAPFDRSRLPTYFVFGEVEKKRIEKRDVQFDDVLPIGSIALDCALREFEFSNYPAATLGFISSYRPSNQPQDYDVDLDKTIFDAHEALFLLAFRYAYENEITLRVIIKAKDKSQIDNEMTYFETLAGGAAPLDFCSVVRDSLHDNEWDNYFAVLSTDLIVCGHSTLGFEAVSTGRKVLFGSSARRDFVKRLGIDDYFEHLPNELKMVEESIDEFRSKISTLRSMPYDQYLTLTESAPIRRHPNNVDGGSSRMARHFLAETLSKT
jgi:surface carbohydrate biosynthesis protein